MYILVTGFTRHGQLFLGLNVLPPFLCFFFGLGFLLRQLTKNTTSKLVFLLLVQFVLFFLFRMSGEYYLVTQ